MNYHAATSLLTNNTGEASCFYCGAPADRPLTLSSSFTDHWTVTTPDSTSICRGCEWMLVEKREIAGKEKPQKTRNYSWLIEANKQTPFTKADKLQIASILLSPPHPPWAFALAESGQKHLLFRTPVNVDQRSPCAVQLELETVVYDPGALRERMVLARRIVAAAGHRGAKEMTVSVAIAAGAEVAEQWEEVACEPLSRLALFVTPSQKECKDD